MQKTIDLHGYNLENAIMMIEREIGKIRLSGEENDILAITGRGIIRGELINYLKSHHINHHFQLGNDGAIVIHVE